MISLKEVKKIFDKGSKHSLLLSNISWQSLERGCRILAGIYTGILLASYLGPESLGAYSYAQSFILLFSPLISLGYDGFLSRDIIFQKDKWADILGSSALLKLLGSTLSILLIWGLTYLDKSIATETKSLIRVLSLSFIFYPFDVFDIWFRAKLKSKNASISKIIALVIINALKILFIYQKAALMSFSWLYVAEFVVNGILQFAFYIKNEPRNLRQWKVSNERIKYVILESWPLLVSTFSLMIYNRIDQIMIGNMLDNKSVGIFSAAGKIADLPLALIMVINASIYPFLAATYKDNFSQFQKQYRIITDLFTALSYIMLAVVLIGAGWIISIYPASFTPGAIILKINFIGLIFIFNSALRNSYLSLTGNQKLLLYSTVLSAILNILLNLFLIPAYGINGAAWASTITEFTALFLFNGVFLKTRDIFKIQANSLILSTLLKRAISNKV